MKRELSELPTGLYHARLAGLLEQTVVGLLAAIADAASVRALRQNPHVASAAALLREIAAEDARRGGSHAARP